MILPVPPVGHVTTGLAELQAMAIVDASIVCAIRIRVVRTILRGQPVVEQVDRRAVGRHAWHSVVGQSGLCEYRHRHENGDRYERRGDKAPQLASDPPRGVFPDACAGRAFLVCLIMATPQLLRLSCVVSNSSTAPGPRGVETPRPTGGQQSFTLHYRAVQIAKMPSSELLAGGMFLCSSRPG